MAKMKQNLVEYSNVLQKALGTSKSANLRAAFPGSPIYNQEISDLERLETYQKILDASNIDSDPKNAAGGYYGMPNYDMNFIKNGLPVIADVETGGGGLPATPFSPNVTSPGAGSSRAADQPEFLGETKNPDTISNFGSGLGGTVEPEVTTKNISNIKIGQYVSGRSYQGSDGKN